MSLPFDYHGDWSRIAKTIVHTSLGLQAGERVILLHDPTYFPDLTEQVRIEIVRSGAVELSAIMPLSPALAQVRHQMRMRETPRSREMEDKAMAELFNLADVFIWLPNTWEHNLFQTEDIIRKWKGRGIHFHWIPGWWPIYGRDPVLFRQLSEMYERALYIDYEALAATQERICTALRAGTVTVTTPGGTDLSFDLTNARFHQNNGNATKQYVNDNARPDSARDREEELPAGVVRTVDVSNVRGRLVVPNETFPAWVGRFVGELRLDFKDDHVVQIDSQFHRDYLQAMWGLETGAKDRIGEFVVGANPELTLLPGHEHDGVLPYFGFGAGVVRFGLGNNLESGGTNNSSFLHNWLFLTDATVTAAGTTIIDAGRLVV